MSVDRKNQITNSQSSHEQQTPLRIGIMGAARIARKNIAAIQNQASSSEVIAIASRSEGRALELRKNHVLEDKHHKVRIISGPDAYDKLLQSTDIDAVYIPLPTCLKKEWVLRALEYNKHVLVEKPVATNRENYFEMISAAKKARRYLMDGTMFVHNTRTKQVLDYITKDNSKSFGKINRINTEFTFSGDDEFFKQDIRVSKDGDPHGCIGDLGWYCIRLSQLVFRHVGAPIFKSAKVTDWKLNDAGVPIDATCLVTFSKKDAKHEEENGRIEHGKCVLSFHCSFVHPLRQRTEIVGSKQCLEMDDYVIPKDGTPTFRVYEQSLTFCDIFTVEKSEVIDSLNGPVQEVMMWRNFSKFCKSIEVSGWLDGDEATMLSSMSCENQLILDALMESIHKDGLQIDNLK